MIVMQSLISFKDTHVFYNQALDSVQPPLVNPLTSNSSGLWLTLLESPPTLLVSGFTGGIVESVVESADLPSFSSSQPHMYTSLIVEQSNIFYLSTPTFEGKDTLFSDSLTLLWM
jgi:hypothetical protein